MTFPSSRSRRAERSVCPAARGPTNDESTSDEKEFLARADAVSTRLPALNALRAFEVAARYLSFREAAGELNVTPAAVSQQVRGLERQLGIALFHRRVRSLELTAAGRAALPHLSEGFERLMAGVEAMGLAERLDFLTVSVPPSFGARWLVPRLERLRIAHPEFEVRIDAKDALANFAGDGVDVAIRYGRGDDASLVVEPLMAVKVFPVCSPALLARRAVPTHPTDLADWTLLHSSWTETAGREPSWRMWLRAAGADGVDPEPGPRFSNEAMLVEAALAGQGMALGNDALVGGELAAGRLVRPFPPAVFEQTEFGYHVVYPERHRATPKVRAFRDWLFEEVASGAG